MRKVLIFIIICAILLSSIPAFAQDTPQFFIAIVPQGGSQSYLVTGVLKMFTVKYTGQLFGKAVVAIYYDGQPYKDYLLSDGQIVNETTYEPAIYYYSPGTVQIYSADIGLPKRLITDRQYIPNVFR